MQERNTTSSLRVLLKYFERGKVILDPKRKDTFQVSLLPLQVNIIAGEQKKVSKLFLQTSYCLMKTTLNLPLKMTLHCCTYNAQFLSTSSQFLFACLPRSWQSTWREKRHRLWWQAGGARVRTRRWITPLFSTILKSLWQHGMTVSILCWILSRKTCSVPGYWEITGIPVMETVVALWSPNSRTPGS